MATPENIQADQHAESQEKIKSGTEDMITRFSEECQRLNVGSAAIVVLDPESKQPRVYLHGSLYSAAKLLNDVLKHVRNEVIESIS